MSETQRRRCARPDCDGWTFDDIPWCDDDYDREAMREGLNRGLASITPSTTNEDVK